MEETLCLVRETRLRGKEGKGMEENADEEEIKRKGKRRI